MSVSYSSSAGQVVELDIFGLFRILNMSNYDANRRCGLTHFETITPGCEGMKGNCVN